LLTFVLLLAVLQPVPKVPSVNSLAGSHSYERKASAVGVGIDFAAALAGHTPRPPFQQQQQQAGSAAPRRAESTDSLSKMDDLSGPILRVPTFPGCGLQHDRLIAETACTDCITVLVTTRFGIFKVPESEPVPADSATALAGSSVSGSAGSAGSAGAAGAGAGAGGAVEMGAISADPQFH
jgi:hypothetical protein